ncbi:MAG: hypothetical protein ABIH42_08460 [Planctomycetota bacterium]
MRNYIFTDREKKLLELNFDGTVIDGLRQLKKIILTSQKTIEADYTLFQKAVKEFKRKSNQRPKKTVTEKTK